MKLSLTQIGQAMKAVGDYENAQDVTAASVQTDSRLVQPGDLFVCIQGERFDGHNFAREAVHKGALAVVVERPLLDVSSDVPMLLVQDSIQALADLAGYWRSQFQGRVVAVTGSAGKTTVKELIAAVLAQNAEVGRNYKNWNNRLGVALSILSMHGREDYWVLEAGVSETGEMEDLAAVLAPDLAVMINVGPAHLQGLHSVQGVAREKARLVDAVPSGGAVVASRDYPELLQALPEDREVVLRTFSTRPDAGGDCCVLSPVDAEGGSLRIKAGDTEIVLGLSRDRSWVAENILAAVCATRYLGCSGEEIQAGLDQTRLPEHRGDAVRCGQVTILDDCYNANPLSMRWALDWARKTAGTEPLVLILGEMKELGEQSEALHEELGHQAAETKPRGVLYFGGQERAFRRGFERAGGSVMLTVQGERDFGAQWRRLGVQSGVVLVKGSRGCALERFVQRLQQELGAA
ncbi:UDP-N-acetylmuramoyl-tripeptide--D-alanyl-D-alanine ligase [Desulfovermiculus halophilus]|uniref:UDP-N-acetylmuramoyl-tripeptide--D-alanyl-D- alanine ligase n=1 Tax=Desulfovermiculus halophilus TaxID=339722 RepID=UPI000481EC55|nr:UDP-N-acetylmuramoyl-tripeptide--D-alanyl-D-alanine ligase [Desulfovermiculus halophilus]